MSDRPLYTVTAIRLGTLTTDTSGMTYGVGAGTEVDIPVWAAAVEGPGLRLLVDTGVADPQRWVGHNPCWQEDDETLPAALAELGWSLGDVDVVVNSHLHYDHAEGNTLLPHARFYVSLAEWEYAKTPIATQRWLYDYDWTDGALTVDDYVLVTQDRHEIAPGIELLQTPGHSRGHQSVLVSTDQGTLCVAGDAACFLDNFRLPTPPGGLTSAELALDSLERIRTASDVVLMNHDPGLAKYQRGGFPAIPDAQPYVPLGGRG